MDVGAAASECKSEDGSIVSVSGQYSEEITPQNGGKAKGRVDGSVTDVPRSQNATGSGAGIGAPGEVERTEDVLAGERVHFREMWLSDNIVRGLVGSG